MNLLDALILALVQGLTEFLPVSSSGHLALAEALLDASPEDEAAGLFYGVLLHVATMLAVVLYFRREIWALGAARGSGEPAARARRVLGLLLLASLPTAAIGLALRDFAEFAFRSPPLVGVGLLLTSLLLASTIVRQRRLARTAGGSPPDGPSPQSDHWLADLALLRWRDALAVGVAQGLAVWPGVSRSGSTIATALWMGVPPLAAARFSLLASLPAIAGGFLLEMRHLEGLPEGLGVQLLGFGVAFGVGLVAIGWLLAAVRRSRLAWYAAYTALLGLLGILSHLVG